MQTVLSDEQRVNFYDLLGPVASSNLRAYVRRRPKDYENKVWDGELFDIIYSHAKNRKERRALKEAIHSQVITKNFRHWDKIIEQFNGFISQSSRVKRGLKDRSYNWNENFLMAKDILYKIYGIRERSLKPILLKEQSDLLRIFKNLDTSAGAVNPGHTKGESLPIIYDVAMRQKFIINQLNNIDYDSALIPALPFHRSQISNYLTEDGNLSPSNDVKQKDRLVWCIDGATVAVEGQYARPVIEALKNSTYSYAGGYSSAQLRQFLYSHCVGKYWVGVDFSSFDQTIPAWLIWEAFSIIKSWFDPKYSNELDWIRYQFINTKIWFPGEKQIWQKHRGIPSGSYFTQIVGSMCNALMLLSYLCSKFKSKEKVLKEISSMKNHPSIFSLTTLGDDGLLFTFTKLDLSDMESFLHYNFGVVMQASKSDSGGALDVPVFLKRHWKRRAEARDYCDMWINTIHYERFNQRVYDNYSPWHIIFGLYLTYEDTMSKYFNKKEIVNNLKNAGFNGDSFKNLRVQDMPGALRAVAINDPLKYYAELKSYFYKWDKAA